MQDLWPNFEEIVSKRNNSIEILRTQAKELYKKTNGTVRATFSKIQYESRGMETFIQGVASASSLLAPREIIDDELQNKADANKLFSQEEYKFEIYNDKFRFRVFKVKYSVLYPITLNIDYGIASDINLDITQTVNDDYELTDLLVKILSSRKLVTIISNLMMLNA